MKKKQTTGERIAVQFYPEGTMDHAVQAKALARRIDSALKRAVREGYISGLYYGYYSKNRPSLTVTNRVTEPQELIRKYGMKEVL